MLVNTGKRTAGVHLLVCILMGFDLEYMGASTNGVGHHSFIDKRTKNPENSLNTIANLPSKNDELTVQRSKKILAICACVTSKSGIVISGMVQQTVPFPSFLNQTILQMLMIPSLERTVTPEERDVFNLRLYLGMNDDDTFWLNNVDQLMAPDWLDVRPAAFKVTQNKIPFNPLMQMAFFESADYLIRVNDDMQFLTIGWISTAMIALQSHAFPNVGVVGPTSSTERSKEIFIYDMVHRTHLLIFQDYYPDVFSSSYVDDWISLVYEPGVLSTKLKDWRVDHCVQVHGRRYLVNLDEILFLQNEILKGRVQVNDWIHAQTSRSEKLDAWRAQISSSLTLHGYYRQSHISSSLTIPGYFQPPSVVFGHVHMPKTAGTTLNGNLSLHFERVCGHKGYSYDAYQVNKRSKKKSGNQGDSIGNSFDGYSRARVPGSILEEIGYEDCDWISVEDSWTFWKQFESWDLPLELHVPCRPSIDHLLSQCNHHEDQGNVKRRTFFCEGDVANETSKCLIGMDRFSSKLLSLRNVNVKCFDWQFGFNGQYSEFITRKGLQKKRRTAEFHVRSTNEPRRKYEECLWGNSSNRKLVEAYLISNYEYYKFCDKCMGSKDDLFTSILEHSSSDVVSNESVSSAESDHHARSLVDRRKRHALSLQEFAHPTGNDTLQLTSQCSLIQPKPGSRRHCPLHYVIFTNDAYVDITINSVLALQHIGARNVLVIVSSENSDACKQVLSHFTSAPSSFKLEVNTVQELGFEVGRLWLTRQSILLHLLQHGIDILWMDADVVFLKNPEIYFDSMKYDVEFGLGSFPNDVYQKWGFTVTAGFARINANAATKALWQRLILEMQQSAAIMQNSEGDILGVDDQVALNRLLVRAGASINSIQDEFGLTAHGLVTVGNHNIVFRCMHDKLFPVGGNSLARSLMSLSSPYAVHPVQVDKFHIAKRTWLYCQGFWYLNDFTVHNEHDCTPQMKMFQYASWRTALGNLSDPPESAVVMKKVNAIVSTEQRVFNVLRPQSFFASEIRVLSPRHNYSTQITASGFPGLTAMHHVLDPFIIQEDSAFYLFHRLVPEDHGRPAVIAVTMSYKLRAWVNHFILIEEDTNLIRPFVFRDEKRWWMLACTPSQQMVVLYESFNFPFQWENRHILLSGSMFIEASIVASGRLYYLLVKSTQSIKRLPDMLRVFWSPHVEGPWEEHVPYTRKASSLLQYSSVVTTNNQIFGVSLVSGVLTFEDIDIGSFEKSSDRITFTMDGVSWADQTCMNFGFLPDSDLVALSCVKMSSNSQRHHESSSSHILTQSLLRSDDVRSARCRYATSEDEALAENYLHQYPHHRIVHLDPYNKTVAAGHVNQVWLPREHIRTRKHYEERRWLRCLRVVERWVSHFFDQYPLRVFETGSGSGDCILSSMFMVNPNIEPSGIDLLRDNCESISRLFHGQFYSGSVYDMQRFVSSSFDLIGSSGVLGFPSDKPLQFPYISEMLRLVEDGGIIALELTNLTACPKGMWNSLSSDMVRVSFQSESTILLRKCIREPKTLLRSPSYAARAKWNVQDVLSDVAPAADYGDDFDLFMQSLSAFDRKNSTLSFVLFGVFDTYFISRFATLKPDVVYLLNTCTASVDYAYHRIQTSFRCESDSECTQGHYLLSQTGCKVISRDGNDSEFFVTSYISDTSLDVIFINICPDERHPMRQIDFWVRKLKPGGLLCGSDYGLGDITETGCNVGALVDWAVRKGLASWHAKAGAKWCLRVFDPNLSWTSPVKHEMKGRCESCQLGAAVEKWPNGAIAAVSLTFDDGKTQTIGEIAEMLDSLQLKASWYIPSAYMHYPLDNYTRDFEPAPPSDPRYVLQRAKDLAANGHEIGCHGRTHTVMMSQENIEAARKEIYACVHEFKQLLGMVPLTHAWPRGIGQDVDEMKRYASKFHLASRGAHSNEKTNLVIDTPEDFHNIPCNFEGSTMTFQQNVANVEYAKEHRAWRCTNNHGTTDSEGNPLSRGYSAASRAELEDYYSYLATEKEQFRVAVEPVATVVQYILQRDSATIEIYSSSCLNKDLEIQLHLKVWSVHEMTVPLTLSLDIQGMIMISDVVVLGEIIPLPQAWPRVVRASETVVRINVIPIRLPQYVRITLQVILEEGVCTTPEDTKLQGLNHQLHPFVVEKDVHTNFLGQHGGAWSWCTHLTNYGLNLNHGLARFLAYQIQPSSGVC